MSGYLSLANLTSLSIAGTGSGSGSGTVTGTANISAAISSSNPFYSGCLHKVLPDRPKRVCNSDDVRLFGFGNGNDHEEYMYDFCSAPGIDYMEIRVMLANWESSVIVGWLIQIILSEYLSVPTTIEAGSYGEIKSFYDPLSRLDFISHNNANAVAFSAQMENGDCQLADKTKHNYQPCAHISSESWDTDSEWVQELIRDRIINVEYLGVLALETWMVTKFTAQEEPDVFSYHGLMGEHNRHKLAALFKRPTTWGEYCHQVSKNNCSTPDQTATRPPQDQDEVNRFFQQDSYTGYFRYTDKNNCTRYPDSCTGHIADFPCGWTSHMESVLYHLNIAMESTGPAPHKGGYTYNQLVQMWRAANATKSNLMMMWWTPEPLYNEFAGTDAEMQRVTLPPPTQACLEAYPTDEDECSPNQTLRVSSPDAACDHNPVNLHKLVSSSLHDITIAGDEATRNPTSEMIRSFQLTELQLSEIFELWQSEQTPREAVCKWATDNLEFLRSAVPKSYPRTLQVEPQSAFSFFLIAFGAIATIIVIVTSYLVLKHQDKNSIKHAQPGFLGLLLAGSLMVALGAILLALPATKGTCIATTWLINIGYTFELVPLIIKVAAINKMMAAANSMNRVNLSIQSLYQTVAFIGVCCCIFLILWTVFDTPRKQAEYSLTESKTADGKHIVSVSYFCGMTSNAWQFAAVGWNMVLLLCASVLAFQSRNVLESFKESRTLAFLCYSHFVFVCLRSGTLFLQDQLHGSTIDEIQSLLYSVDTMATVVIYFIPKLRKERPRNGSSALPVGTTLTGRLSGFQTPGALMNYMSGALGVPRLSWGVNQRTVNASNSPSFAQDLPGDEDCQGNEREVAAEIEPFKSAGGNGAVQRETEPPAEGLELPDRDRWRDELLASFGPQERNKDGNSARRRVLGKRASWSHPTTTSLLSSESEAYE